MRSFRLSYVARFALIASVAACSGKVDIGVTDDAGTEPDGAPRTTPATVSGTTSSNGASEGTPTSGTGLPVVFDGGVSTSASTGGASSGQATTTANGDGGCFPNCMASVGPVDATPSVDASACSTAVSNSVTIPASALGSAGSAGYSVALDPTTTLDGAPTMLVQSTSSATSSGFGASVAENGVPASAVGQHYRLSAQVKTENAQGAYLWFRIDTSTEEVLVNGYQPAFIALVGTNGWTTIEDVLEVPAGATGFVFGSIIEGTGSVWVGPITLEQVAECVPVDPSTSYALPDGG